MSRLGFIEDLIFAFVCSFFMEELLKGRQATKRSLLARAFSHVRHLQDIICPSITKGTPFLK